MRCNKSNHPIQTPSYVSPLHVIISNGTSRELRKPHKPSVSIEVTNRREIITGTFISKLITKILGVLKVYGGGTFAFEDMRINSAKQENKPSSVCLSEELHAHEMWESFLRELRPARITVT
jgi:hypothetical protein